jgi:hypothetical protein
MRVVGLPSLQNVQLDDANLNRSVSEVWEPVADLLTAAKNEWSMVQWRG